MSEPIQCPLCQRGEHCADNALIVARKEGTSRGGAMAVRYRGRREGWAPLFVRDDPIAKDLYLRTHAFCRAMQERANAAETEAATVKSLLAATQERLAQIERDEDHRKTLAR